MEGLKRYIREIPDWPKPGILFYDITTLIKDPVGLHHSVDALANYYVGRLIDRVVGVEARGFIFAPMVAYRLNAGFVPVRKPKKLPAETTKVSYSLEYGQDTLEMHRDAITPGQEVRSLTICSPRGARRRLSPSLSSRKAAAWRGWDFCSSSIS